MELKDMSDLLEKQAQAWEEFKSANDNRLQEIEKRGHASDDSLAKIAAINAEISALQTPVPLAPVAPAEVAPAQSEPIAAVAPAEVAIEAVADAAPVPAQPEPETLDLVTPAPAEAAPVEVAPEAPVNQGARKGGKNAGLMKAAAKAARNRVLILADRSQEHVLKAAE